MKEAMIEKSSPAVTEEELLEIAEYSRRPLSAEEVYTFTVVLCDNDLDRDFECFGNAALEKLALLFKGKSGIFDHDPKGEKQTARIYRCWVDRDEGRMNFLGEEYRALKARAYMVRTAANADLILEIEAGIKKEVSVGCAVEHTICSVCGADRREKACPHHPGRRYGGELCYTLLADPTDAYEWSFVAVPCQPAAGVTKSRGTAKALSLTPERAIREMAAGELHLDAASAAGLHKHIQWLEEQSEAAGRYRETLCKEIRRATLMAQPECSPELLEKAMSPLTTAELESMLALCQKQMDERFPPLVQTAPAKKEADRAGYDYFKI